MSVSKGAKKEKSKSTSSVDNKTQDYMQQVMAAATAAGKAGPSPLTTGAGDYYSNLMRQGNLGMGALSGDPNAVKTMMNPYQSQVVDATNRQWDNTDQHTMNAVNDRAVQAGAFGGSRHGIATGTALADNNMNRMGQISGLLSGGFNDAMGRAGTLAGYGMAGAGANANLGMGGVGNSNQWLMEMLKRGYLGPMGTQSNSSGTSVSSGFTGGGG